MSCTAKVMPQRGLALLLARGVAPLGVVVEGCAPSASGLGAGLLLGPHPATDSAWLRRQGGDWGAFLHPPGRWKEARV